MNVTLVLLLMRRGEEGWTVEGRRRTDRTHKDGSRGTMRGTGMDGRYLATWQH